MLETLLREMDEEGVADESGETVVHDNDQVPRVNLPALYTLLFSSYSALSLKSKKWFDEASIRRCDACARVNISSIADHQIMETRRLAF